MCKASHLFMAREFRKVLSALLASPLRGWPSTGTAPSTACKAEKQVMLCVPAASRCLLLLCGHARYWP